MRAYRLLIPVGEFNARPQVCGERYSRTQSCIISPSVNTHAAGDDQPFSYLCNILKKDAVIILFSSYVLILLKSYILVSYAPFLVLFLLLKNVNLVKNTFVRVLLGISLLVGIMEKKRQVIRYFPKVKNEITVTIFTIM